MGLPLRAIGVFAGVWLCLTTNASGAITRHGQLSYWQSGTPAPEGFDPTLAVMDHGVVVIADEPRTHRTWIGYPIETNSGSNQVSYTFEVVDRELRFYPVVTPFTGMGTMDMAYYLLWEPAPGDFSFETYRVNVDMLVTTSGPFLGSLVAPGPSLPEPSGIALFLLAGLARRRIR